MLVFIWDQYSVLNCSLRCLKHCCEFRSGCAQELLYSDDLVMIAESMEELIEKFKEWKEGMETKGILINMKKTKIMVSVTLGK